MNYYTGLDTHQSHRHFDGKKEKRKDKVVVVVSKFWMISLIPASLSLLPPFSAHKKRPQASPPMSIYPTKSYPITKGLSEFEILKASHKYVTSTNYTHTYMYMYGYKKRFLREDTDESQTNDNENGEDKEEAEEDKEEGRINTSTQKKKHKATAWEDRLAENYYHSLYREFAVCDLKHYKSGHVRLRFQKRAFFFLLILNG